MVFDRHAVIALYQGLREGEAIPWRVWIIPLAAWTGLALSVYTVFFSLSAIIACPWMENEKLTFPLVQVPLALARDGSEALFPPLLRSPVMWVFFAVPFLIHAVNGLHFHFPIIPQINIHRIPLDQYFTERPWDGLRPFWLRISFSVIGLTYLLPTQLSFSLWFFYFFFLMQQVIGSALGAQMPPVQAYPVKAFVAHQMIGGILFFGMAGVVSIVRMWGEQGARYSGGRDSSLPRWALFTGAMGMTAICIFGQLVGAGWEKTFIIFALYFLVHLVAVRLVCEGGMLYVQHPFRPINIMLACVGTAGLGRGAIPPLVLFDHLWMLDNRSPLMPCIVQGLRLGKEVNLRSAPFMAAMAGSVVTAVIFSYLACLYLMYRHGGLALNTWFTTYYSNNLFCGWTSHLMQSGEKPSPVAWLTMAGGAVTMAFLLFMHRNFLAWPFHPIGYLMGASWPMINFWFSIFLGWMIKAGVLRYGGARVYRNLLPGFLGLILAEFFSAGMWVIVDLLAGVRGHEIFSF